MTAILEHSVDIFNVAPVAEGPPEEQDLARNALCRYFGTQVVWYDAHLRKDYAGPASDKKQVDGAMVVRCEVEVAGTLETRELEINDNFRPFDKDVLTHLGAIANANWDDPQQLRMIRDICA